MIERTEAFLTWLDKNLSPHLEQDNARLLELQSLQSGYQALTAIKAQIIPERSIVMTNIQINIPVLEELTAAVIKLTEILANGNGNLRVVEAEAKAETPVAKTTTKKTTTAATAKKAEKAPGREIKAEEIRAKFIALAHQGLRNALKEILASHGVDNVSALDEADYVEVYAKLEALGSQEGA